MSCVGFVSTLRLGGRDAYAHVWHAPILTQPSHRSPGSAMSAESSVGYVTNRAAKDASHGERPFFSVRETIGILK